MLIVVNIINNKIKFIWVLVLNMYGVIIYYIYMLFIIDRYMVKRRWLYMYIYNYDI